MLLKKVTITGFRSIRQTEDLHIDQFVTVLIGANDHGKTNLLEAVRALNDDYELPAAFRNWDTSDQDAPRIEWTFALTPAEKEDLNQTAAKRLAEQLDREKEANAALVRESEAPPAAPTPAAPAEAAATTAPATPTPAAPAASTPTAATPAASAAAPAAMPAPVSAPPASIKAEPRPEFGPTISNEVISAIRDLNLVKFVRGGPGSKVSVELPDQLREHEFIARWLLNSRPRVELFTGTTKITDSITLSELDDTQNEFMQGMSRKAEIWEDRKSLFVITPKTRKRLADASQVLTKRIREEWQQGKDLTFILQHGGEDGNRIDISISDPSVAGQYVLPTQRSTGFSAFFGMSTALFARKEASAANNYIFVFDEPATALHPHGQVNVQRVFETLSRKNQIVYTTHSIFMVNKNYPPRNRAVTKTEKGTLVDHKPYIRNWKAVRSNLGLIFSNNFFVADTTLLVEGPSDEVYFASLFRTCDRLGLIDVDLNLFSIVDSGTSAEMVAMARLMADEGRRVLAVVDGDQSGTTVKKRLELLNRALPKGTPPVEVIALPKNKSVEDCILYPKLLRDALVQAAGELVTENIRKFKDRVTTETIKKTLDEDLAKHKELTLGRAIQEVSKSWFDDEEPVSKLHVARIYDELVEALPEKDSMPTKPDLDRGKDLVVNLHSKLGLPEKVARENVVETA